jgi:ribosomal protein S17
MAHNETEAKIGDTVVIEESRPVSKNKKWNVVKVETKK